MALRREGRLRGEMLGERICFDVWSRFHVAAVARCLYWCRCAVEVRSGVFSLCAACHSLPMIDHRAVNEVANDEGTVDFR